MEAQRTLSPIPKTEGIQGQETNELLGTFGEHPLNLENAELDRIALPHIARMADEERTSLLTVIGVDPQSVQISQGHGIPALRMSEQTRSLIRSGFRLRFRNWFQPSTFPSVLEKTAPLETTRR